MSKMPKVALLVETARGYGRGVLHGIVRYARLHGPWAFYVTPGDFVQSLPQMEEWGGTGIIARVATPQVAKAILATGLPVVALDLSQAQLAPGSPWSRMSQLTSDSEGAARLAAKHLLEKGLRHFGFVGIAGKIWSDLRQRAFVREMAEAGYETLAYPCGHRRRLPWGREQAVMSRWLSGLPKPVGIMACNDDRGREVLVACRQAKLRVPEEVAVIGVDNDELLCDLSDPPLSSVALGAERAGFEAAALLDDLMAGRVKKPQRLVAAALGVVARRSTDVLVHEDPEVAAALRFIHDRAGQPIRVYDVVGHLGDARRTFEIRFRHALGRSIHTEIQRTRLERAKQLLLETDLPLPNVARACGFRSPSYLAAVFRRHLGVTPVKYRANNRNR
jgi:LacI family transcriptional regulator